MPGYTVTAVTASPGEGEGNEKSIPMHMSELIDFD
jgi:hypothetical protein